MFGKVVLSARRVMLARRATGAAPIVMRYVTHYLRAYCS